MFSFQQAASEKAGSQIAAFYTRGQVDHRAGRSRDREAVKTPDPYFRYAVAVTYILQKEYWQAHLQGHRNAADADDVHRAVALHEVVQGDGTIECPRFDGYWGRRPAVRTIALKVIVSERDAPARDAVRARSTARSASAGPDRPVEADLEHDGPARAGAPHRVPLTRHRDRAVERRPRSASGRVLDRQGRARRAVLRGYGRRRTGDAAARAVGRRAPQSQVKEFYRTLPKLLRSASPRRRRSSRSRGSRTDSAATLPYPDSAQTLGRRHCQLART